MPAQAQDERCDTKSGYWDYETNQCVIYTGFEINIRYPVEVIGKMPLETAVDEYFEAARGNFLSFYDPSMPSFVPVPWLLQIDYQLFDYAPHINGVVFTQSEFTGRAHGNSYFYTLLYDDIRGILLGLEDVFVDIDAALTVIYPMVEQHILEQLGDFTDTDWVASGSGTNPDNYRNFTLTPYEIIFFFPPYQVAAYAAGPMEVHIPLDDIRPFLAPPFNAGAQTGG